MTKERLQKAEKLIDFVQNDQKIAASEYRELQKMNNNHESSNKDCLLILEQSERIKELESAMQEYVIYWDNFYSEVPVKRGYANNWHLKFKQLLSEKK